MFYNSSQPIGQVVEHFTQYGSGTIFLTLLVIFLVLFAVLIMSNVPLEFSIAFMLPLIIVFMAYESSFMIIGGVLVLLLGFILGIILFK